MVNRKKRKRSPWLWVLFSFLVVLLIAVLGVGGYIIKLAHTLQQVPEFSNETPQENEPDPEEDLTGLDVITDDDTEGITGNVNQISHDADAVDVLLLGVDSRSDNFSGRSDVMLLIRVNSRTGQIKMVSFMRDLLVDIPGHGKNRINTAYMFGGPDMALQVVNDTFGLNIDKYMIFNFYGTASIIDMMGGVTIDIQSNEIDTTNNVIKELNNLFEKNDPLITVAGPQKLNGLQATAYMRNRKTGTDVARTGRQRTVLMTLLKTLGQVEMTRLPALVNTGVNYLRTNIPVTDLPGYATMLMDMSNAEVVDKVFPTPYKNYNYKNMAVVVADDFDAQVEELHRFLLE